MNTMNDPNFSNGFTTYTNYPQLNPLTVDDIKNLYSYQGTNTVNISTTNNTTAPVIYSSDTALHVSGPAKFEDDIHIKGVSLMSLLKTIEDRLAILQPNPEKLEKFEALKKAYEHYKLLEKLCQE